MARQRYVVSYDIRDERRLRAVHKRMKGFGYPLQYSVFICDLDAMEKIALRKEIGDVMHHGVDSVVIIALGDPSGRGTECFEFMGAGRSLPESGPRIV
ncbi:MAG: CRISPR-associated endonuclease Cas2 [Acidimicrobiia bacterium]|nr:CRISPR-associated endonuclease Cas2 [Acidimicrobiia bacterium]